MQPRKEVVKPIFNTFKRFTRLGIDEKLQPYYYCKICNKKVPTVQYILNFF